MVRSLCVLSFSLINVAFTSCGPGKESLYDISGTANFNGKPIPAGIIYFDPDPTKGGSGTQGNATIKDGKYNTAEGGRGVKPGPYIVRITGFDGKPSGGESPYGSTLFNETEEKHDVLAQNHTINFEIKKKK